MGFNIAGIVQRGLLSRKGIMLCTYGPVRRGGLLCWGILTVVVLGLVGGCGPAHYKADADKEVYQIIDRKWKEDFGQKANYRIKGAPPSPNDLPKFTPPSSVLNLREAIALATANNRDYQTQKDLLYLRALDLTLARHEFARQWFGTIDATYTRDFEDESLSYQDGWGFEQLLADGAQISAGIAIDWVRFLTGDPRTSLGSVLSATVTQPLLRGAGRKIVMENLTQAERDTLYQIRTFNRYRKTFVVSIVNEYYGVLQQKDRMLNARKDLQRKRDSKERLEWEFKAGRRSRIDVDEAEQDVLRSQNSLVRAQQTYEQLLDRFKITLALPTDSEVELDQNELSQLEKARIREPDFNVQTALTTALGRRLDLANSQDAFDDAARKVMVAANGLGMDLNLVGGANVGSTPETKFDRLMFHRGTYQLGIEAALPLDRKAERNAYRTALITLDQQWRAYRDARDNVKYDVLQAYRQLREAAERYDIQKNSLEVAERRVASNELLLDAGRVTVRVLLQAQDALVQAQNEVTSALVDFLIARLSFYRDTGILQVKPDGMWEE